MGLPLDIVMSFLRESFLIEQWKYYRKNLKNADDEKKHELNANLLLNNTYKLRILRDPGCYTYVLDQARRDARVISEVKEFILKLREEAKRLPPNNIMDKEILDEFFNEGDIYKAPAKKYLTSRYNAAKERGDSDEAFAVIQLMKVYETHDYYGFKLYGKSSIYECQEDSLYDAIEYTDDWRSVGIRYAVKTLDNFELYYGQRSEGHQQFHFHAFRNPHFAFSFLEYIFNVESISIDKSQYHTLFIEYDKFISDCLTIAAMIWFNNKSESGKIAILNSEYPIGQQSPFNYSSEELHQLTKDWFEEINHYGEWLLKGDYVDEAQPVYKHLIEACENNVRKANLYNDLAEKLRMTYKVDEAIVKYIKLYDLLSVIENQIEDIPQASTLYTNSAYISVKIGEMHYHLGEPEKAKAWMERAKEHSQCYSLSEQLAILWEISLTYRTVRDSKSEYKYLNMMLELDVNHLLDSVIYNDFWSRLFELNSAQLKGYDFAEWKIKLDMGKYNYLFNTKAMQSAESFQLTSAIEILESILPINENPLILENLSLLSFEASMYDKAEMYVGRLLCLDGDSPSGHMIRAMIRLHCGDIDTSLKEITTSITNFDKTGIGSQTALTYYLGELIRCKETPELGDLISRLDEQYEGLPNVSLTIADILYSWGYFELALPIYQGIIKRDISTDELAGIYENMSRIFLSNRDFDRALKCYDESPRLMGDPAKLHYGKAIILMYALRFDKALGEIEDALSYEPENLEYGLKKNELIQLSQNIIKFDLITDNEVKIALYSAEKLLLRLYTHANEDVEYDYGSAPFDYGKGLESMLHHRLSMMIRKNVYEKYPKGIPPKFWRGEDGVQGLPELLKRILIRNTDKIRSISLGEWPKFEKIISEYQSNDVVKIVLDIYRKDINEKHIEFNNTYDSIRQLRNRVDHHKIMTREQVLKERKEIVMYLNHAIEKLY